MRKLTLALVAILALTGIAAAACSSSDNTQEQSPAAGDQSASVKVTQKDFAFDPDTLNATAGQPLSVTVTNNGSVQHTFTISELNVDQAVNPGQSVTVTVTPTSGGQFTFFCRFHRSSGMMGTLTVAGGAGGTGSSATTAPAAPTSTATSGGGYGGYGSGY